MTHLYDSVRVVEKRHRTSAGSAVDIFAINTRIALRTPFWDTGGPGRAKTPGRSPPQAELLSPSRAALHGWPKRSRKRNGGVSQQSRSRARVHWTSSLRHESSWYLLPPRRASLLRPHLPPRERTTNTNYQQNVNESFANGEEKRRSIIIPYQL